MTTFRARALQPAVVPADTPEYVEFYLGNMYTWKEAGVARIISFLRNCNVDGAQYSFDPGVGWFFVRCLRSDTRYIQTKFIDFQSDIEREIRSLKTMKAADAPIETFDHPDVEMPKYLPLIMDMSSIEAPSEPVGNIGFENGQKISLVVPNSLQDYPEVGAWQGLQSKDKAFDDDFISLAAKKKIERAHNVAIVADNGQKVIFIGGYDAEVLGLVKSKLTTLIEDYISFDQNIQHLRHVFFVSQPVHGSWRVEIRDTMNLNPTIRRSTILDPWYFGGNYGCLARASCLRACLEDPLRKGPRHALWSVRGPFPKPLFDPQKRRNIAEAFKGLKVAERRRVAPQVDDDHNENGLANWLEGVSQLKSEQPGPDVIDPREVCNPMNGLGDDEPIPLDFGRVGAGRTGDFDDDEPVALDFEHYAFTKPQTISASQIPRPETVRDPNILDQDDPVLRDPNSALQRPMLQPKRTILVDHPDNLPKDGVQTAGPQGHRVDQGTELERLVISIQRLLSPMTARYGLVELRAGIGRFFASSVASSGLATNTPNEPAKGWEAEALREKIVLQDSFFTQCLTCSGNDVDMLVKLKIENTGIPMWRVHSRDAFIDFRFKVMQGDEAFWDLVLEVNTKDYSWRLRDWENECGSTVVHCLRQHWDFRVRLLHDRSLEFEEYFGNFARALIESLEVSAPKLQFRNVFANEPAVFHKDLPIHVSDARIRQVCRFQHDDKRTYLDITRTLPTKPTHVRPPQSSYIEVTTLPAGPARKGEFYQWYEAEMSSVRLEEILRENETLIPGEKASWCSEDLAQEVRHLCKQAAAVVEQIDAVGVGCDNGFDANSWDSLAIGAYSF